MLLPMGGGGSTDLSSATAVVGSVLAGNTFFSSSSDDIQIGTMANRGAVTITPSASTQSILAGYHNGSGTVAAVSFNAANVLAGTTIAGTAGTMVNRGAVTITPSATAQTILAGYHNGSGTVSAVSFNAANVLTGTTIAGTAGTMSNWTNIQTITEYRYNTDATSANGYMRFYPPNNGYYTTGSTIGLLNSNLASDIGLTAAKLAQGNTILGIVGAATGFIGGTATPATVLSGYTFASSESSAQQTGTMVNRGAITYTPSASAQTIAAGYHNGSGSVAAVTFTASNVLAGVTIAGTAGTMTNYSGTTLTNTSGGTNTSTNHLYIYTPNTGYMVANSTAIQMPFTTVSNAIGLTSDKLVSGNTLLGIVGSAYKVHEYTISGTTSNINTITDSNLSGRIIQYVLIRHASASTIRPSVTTYTWLNSLVYKLGLNAIATTTTSTGDYLESNPTMLLSGSQLTITLDSTSRFATSAYSYHVVVITS